MTLKRLALVGLLGVLAIAVGLPGSASADTSPGYAHTTAVGIHNTYNNTAFAHLAQALDTGTGLIELDVYADTVLSQWRVNHDLFGQTNNCTTATTAAQLYTGSVNHNLNTCLDDLRIWGAAHPTHAPVIVKVELKVGFEANKGLGPAQFDALLSSKLGTQLYTPTNLLTQPNGSRYASLDAAAQADAWPSRSALAGRFIFELIPGTVELDNPFDTLHTDVEYADYLRDNNGNGEAFPADLGAASGDPRTKYSSDIRGWFVVFDGDASTYVSSGIDTSWYDTHHYLLIMTDAYLVSPALSQTSPSQADAQARIALLAQKHATIVSTDWVTVPGILGSVLPRG